MPPEAGGTVVGKRWSSFWVIEQILRHPYNDGNSITSSDFVLDLL
jgi:hypothetical protein